MNIAIDGPSGAGKSTIAKILAKNLGITYLDTGAMYRALGLKAYLCGVSPCDEDAVKQLLTSTVIDVGAGENGTVVFLDEKDVSSDIRKNNISKMASDISALQSVRIYMVALQQKIAASKDSVLDGRDIGTVVLPDAEFKFFLTASAEVRAHRRYLELLSRGENCNEADILRDIISRDYNDSHRKFSPLKKADDAIEIDTTDLDIDGVENKIMNIIKEKK